MKKFINILTGVAVAAAMQSCVDTEKPVFQEPTTFTINTPALQNEYLATTSDMEDKSTFVLYASQPDYGFAAQASYSVQVSLSENFVDATETQEANYRDLSNQDMNSGEMKFRTYDLAVAMTQLLGFDSDSTEDDYQDYVDNGGKTVMPVYFRAVCEIPGVPGSRIVSSNVVSYNKVQFSFAVPKAGFIYYVGDTIDKGATWNEPSASFQDFYDSYKLIEPEIGSKLYAATFNLPATASIKTLDPANPQNYTTQFRFFTELSGWNDASKMVGSHTDDFYVVVITDEFVDGQFKGDAVYGKGNWGVFLDEETEMTLVVSLQDSKKPKVWFRYGKWDVQVGLDATGMNEPVFKEAAE
ncbi:MAG: SusE domain-containing protein [Muribaculaceae bacterium]|nr:SusE domain-containing protein [Muribaculaceae bacterium]